MNSSSLSKRLAMAILAVGLIGFFVYVKFFAGEYVKLFLGANHIDKIAHFAGGVFIAMVFEWQRRLNRLAAAIFLFVAVIPGWELYEILFDSDTRYFYSINPDLWRLDALGDIVAAVLGGYGYWVFLLDRRILKPAEGSQPVT